ncbi:MAG TPA: hypothetical protein VHI98_09315 [Vicinamibacterales bacterium]|nr:hypothetical protein [Vicinamibacterales bacterium]
MVFDAGVTALDCSPEVSLELFGEDVDAATHIDALLGYERPQTVKPGMDTRKPRVSIRLQLWNAAILHGRLARVTS